MIASPALTPAAPCALCLTTGGPLQANTHRAARVRTVAGVVCYTCYASIRYRLAHGLDPATGDRLSPRPRSR